ncbi:MAG: hypothetical protein Fur0041_18260 [Bacteroidia bacterium]
MSAYFSFEELKALKNTEHKKLTTVFYHNWLNKANPHEAFEFTDKIELRFEDGSRLVVGTSDETEQAIALDPDFDAEKRKLMLLHEFNGKIDQRSVDMTGNPLWSFAAGQTLLQIALVKEEENLYRNDAMLLDFGDEKLEIRPGMDGLIVEPFEDI